MLTAIRCFAAVALLGSLLICSVSAQRPNILLILVDDVGREVQGCYGGTSYQTPHIDAMAASGVRFEHAYTMPVCHPTRITLLTGQYPYRLGHPQWGSFPREVESRTLGNMLKAAGYSTVVAGKWQLALLKDDLEQPHRMGFDEYCLYGWHEGPWYYQPHIWQNGKLRADVKDRYGPDVICDYIIDFMKRNAERPFFAFYSMSLCHAETNDLEEPAPFGPHGRYDTYAEMVGKMDANVGRLMAALDELDLRENTLVVFTSDNGTAARNLISAHDGEYIYEKVISYMDDRPIRGGKATLTDWGTRVPLIVSWPDTIEAGGVNGDLTDVSDILPSLMDVAEATLAEEVELDGRSLAAQLRNVAPPRRWVFAEHKGRCFVRDQQWKLYDDGRFFSMQNDPDEQQPLSVDSLSRAASIAHRELRDVLEGLNYQAYPDD
jgi:arylsulfatase A